MAKLSMFLPPFAGDYSGACSVLFGLDCLTIIVDASCCTRNYVEYDETRWKRRRKSTFSAQLRTIEATLGDDERIVSQIERAVGELGPSCVALVGTPVPAIVGMDLDGMAHEVEERCGLPAIGVATTGFDTYEHGASLALRKLVDRFAGASSGEGSPASGLCAGSAGTGLRGSDRDGGCGRCGESEGARSQGARSQGSRPRANVLGLTPQDFMSEERMRAVEDAVRAEGFDLAWGTAGDYSLADIERAAHADVSFVVAWSGFAAAQLLDKRFGVPYRMGFPLDAGNAAAILGSGLPAAIGDDSLVGAAEILIVHDQVVGGTVRAALRARFGDPVLASEPALAPEPRIAVASFFDMNPNMMQPGDFRIESEAQLIAYLEANPNAAVVGDPLLRRFPGFGGRPFVPFPHEAVSSTLFA